MNWHKTNLNNRILFKVNDPHFLDRVGKAFRAEGDNWFSGELWEFMQSFGYLFRPGVPIPIDLAVEIEVES